MKKIICALILFMFFMPINSFAYDGFVKIFFKDKTTKRGYFIKEDESSITIRPIFSVATYNKEDIDAVIAAENQWIFKEMDYKTVIYKDPNISLSTRSGHTPEFKTAAIILISSPVFFIIANGYHNAAINSYNIEDRNNLESVSNSFSIAGLIFLVDGIAEMMMNSNVEQTLPNYSLSLQKQDQVMIFFLTKRF